MKKNPLVSILINCYNAEKFISRAITSVIKQTYSNWELIILDDGSYDNTVKIIKQFKDKRIFFYKNKKNLGLGKSRIKATKYLKGKLISILDADDYFHPKKIEKQVIVFNKNKNVFLCSTFANIYQDNKLKLKFITSKQNKEIKNNLIFYNVLPHSSIMYVKSEAKKVGWYSNKLEYSQDYDLTLKLLEKGDLFLVKEFLTDIYQDGVSMSISNSLKKLVIKESLLLNKKISKNKSLSKKKLEMLKTIKKIYQIKINFLSLKKNFLKSLKNLIFIFLENPKLVFKLNFLKKIRERRIYIG